VSPQNLSPLYEKHPELWLVLSALILSTAAGIFLFLFRRKALPIIGTFCAFLLLIFPMLGITQSGVQLYADRFTYFASVPFSVLLAGVLGKIKILRRTVYAAFGGIIGIFALQSGTYAFLWTDEFCLWKHAVMENATSAIAQNGVGQALMDQGFYEESLIHFQRASELDDRSAMVLHNTALALAGLGRYTNALEKLERAFHLPGPAGERCKMMLARGWMYERMGDISAAEANYALVADDVRADAFLRSKGLQARAALRVKTGRTEQAVPDLIELLRLPNTANDSHAKAHFALKMIKNPREK
jgi:hypothetical protein